jgi:hypothetical protein
MDYKSIPEAFEREKYLEYQDIHGSVDIYNRRRNVPIEFKTSRTDINEPKSFHIEQLKYHMTMLNASDGYMLYQCLYHFGNKLFKDFRITMSSSKRADQRKKLVDEINSLKKGLDARDLSLAREISNDIGLN